MSKSRPQRALAGAALALALAPTVNVLVAAAARRRLPGDDPTALVWSSRSLFLEAFGLTAYVTVALAFVGAALARRSPAGAGRAFAALCALSAVASLFGAAR